MTKAARVAKKDPPYIFQMYNLTGYFAGYGTKGSLKLINPLIDALNDIHHLPEMIIVIPDIDLLMDKKFNSTYKIGEYLHDIIKQHDLHLERRKQDLLAKRPGAINASQPIPKTIWVRVMKRPNPENFRLTSNAYTFRGKFNSILEERLLDGNADLHHIMSIEVDQNSFNSSGELTDSGKKQFWSEVDKAIGKFDRGEIALKPRNFNAPAGTEGPPPNQFDPPPSERRHREHTRKCTTSPRNSPGKHRKRSNKSRSRSRNRHHRHHHHHHHRSRTSRSYSRNRSDRRRRNRSHRRHR